MISSQNCSQVRLYSQRVQKLRGGARRAPRVGSATWNNHLRTLSPLQTPADDGGDYKTILLRNSASWNPSSSEASERKRRRGGPVLRGGGSSFQSRLAVGVIYGSFPSTTSNLHLKRESEGNLSGGKLIETIDGQPWPEYEADMSFVLQLREFYGSGINRTRRMDTGRTRVSGTLLGDPEPKPESHPGTSAVAKDVSQGGHHALVNTGGAGERCQDKDTDRVDGKLDSTPIIMCDRRSYSDWIGYWGK